MHPFRRLRFEAQRLPRPVRIFRRLQVAFFLLFCALVISLELILPGRPPLIAYLPFLVGFMVCLFAQGLLMWRNYQGTADIWVENIRTRGLDSIGIGWLVDRGTIRAGGFARMAFAVLFVVSGTAQAIWPELS